MSMLTYYVELLAVVFPSEWINFDLTRLLATFLVCLVIIDTGSRSFTSSLPFLCVSGCRSRCWGVLQWEPGIMVLTTVCHAWLGRTARWIVLESVKPWTLVLFWTVLFWTCSKLSGQGMNFKSNISVSLLTPGLQWQRESIHRHPGPHDQHREWFLADGLAGRQSRDCHDHKTQGKKWGMAFPQGVNVINFLLLWKSYCKRKIALYLTTRWRWKFKDMFTSCFWEWSLLSLCEWQLSIRRINTLGIYLSHISHIPLLGNEGLCIITLIYKQGNLKKSLIHTSNHFWALIVWQILL